MGAQPPPPTGEPFPTASRIAYWHWWLLYLPGVHTLLVLSFNFMRRPAPSKFDCARGEKNPWLTLRPDIRDLHTDIEIRLAWVHALSGVDLHVNVRAKLLR